jgi:penicillin-binding protein 2
MLVIDEMKKNDTALRTLSIVVLAGMGVLIVSLWYLQVVSSKKFQESLRTQSFRTVRIPSLRGKICDVNGVILAESRPTYNITLYLDELSRYFQGEFQRMTRGRKLNKAERAAYAMTARFNVVSNLTQRLGEQLHQPLRLDATKFHQHYERSLVLPMVVLDDVPPATIAQFMEQPNRIPGFDLEMQPLRYYPNKSTAAHVLGFLQHSTAIENDEDSFFNYRLPDYTGIIGVESVFDQELRGKAGAKSVQVNYLGYRQSEMVWSDAEVGRNLFLTIDTRVQQAAEKALRGVSAQARGAVVVMNPRNGDILALVSAPAFDPNLFIPHMAPENWAVLNDEDNLPTLNRATFGSYAPGSIFKIIVALTCMESRVMTPEEVIYCEGYYQLGRRRIDDLAPPGNYDFRKAFKLSSNAYFIHYGLKAGIDSLMDMGQRFGLGQRTGIPTRQEVGGFYPSKESLQRRKERGEIWRDGDTANLSIGQGDITVTPLQMAIMTSAIANGGKVYHPRLVARLQSQDADNPVVITNYPSGQLRNDIHVNPKNLEVIRSAMLADVEDRDGTGRQAAVAGMKVCGKTGTAQVKKNGVLVRHDTWFVSFAPYDAPRYVVVVLVEGGGSGGGTCAPVAQKVYSLLQQLETQPVTTPGAVASNREGQ